MLLILFFFFFSFLLKFFIFFFSFVFFKNFFLMIFVLLSVAFFTLFERKLLASMQRRRGPNMIGFYGLFQAIADGFKLLSKESVIPFSSNIFFFILSPSITFILALFSWAVIPFYEYILICDLNLSVLFLFFLSSVSVYSLIMSG